MLGSCNDITVTAPLSVLCQINSESDYLILPQLPTSQTVVLWHIENLYFYKAILSTELIENISL